jgi:hypothetical protein
LNRRQDMIYETEPPAYVTSLDFRVFSFND